jgi:hypothetical protein
VREIGWLPARFGAGRFAAGRLAPGLDPAADLDAADLRLRPDGGRGVVPDRMLTRLP